MSIPVERHACLESERSVLASILIDPDAIGLVEDLDPLDFFSPPYACLFGTMRRLASQGSPVDFVTVRGALEHMGDLARAGGDETLTDLVNAIPRVENIEAYSDTIRTHAIVRRLFASCARTLAARKRPLEDPKAFLDERTAELVELATAAHADGSVEHVSEVTPRVRAQLVERQSREGVAGLSTGFGSLDRMLAGMTPGQLIVIAGRPGMGKSALAQAIILANVSEGFPSLIFSLEMSREEWVHRMCISQASIDGARARRGLMAQAEWARFNAASARLNRMPLHIDATPALTPEKLRAKARRAHARHGLRLIVVDYLQLMTSSNAKASPEQRVADASMALKSLAKELGVPVVAVAQLNRELERRGGDRRPAISDLRQSGQIEQDADVIAFVYRDVMYHPTTADPRAAEIIVRKQRMGPTGTVKAQFRAEFTRFEDFDPREFDDDDQRQFGGPRGI